MSEKKTAFHFTPYLYQTYLKDLGMKELYGYGNFQEGVDMPFGQAAFAECVDGHIRSLFAFDQELPFEDSVAKKIIEDPRCEVFRQSGFFQKTGKEGIIYYLPIVNKDAIRFRPDLDAYISNSANVETEGAIELRFCFDEGYTFSVLRPFKTGGSFSVCVADLIEDELDVFEDNDSFFEGFLSECPNAVFDEEHKVWLIAASSKSAISTDLEFPVADSQDMSIMRSEFRRALTVTRLVDLKETIF